MSFRMNSPEGKSILALVRGLWRETGPDGVELSRAHVARLVLVQLLSGSRRFNHSAHRRVAGLIKRPSDKTPVVPVYTRGHIKICSARQRSG
jgi:hypothetical protein